MDEVDGIISARELILSCSRCVLILENWVKLFDIILRKLHSLFPTIVPEILKPLCKSFFHGSIRACNFSLDEAFESSSRLMIVELSRK